MRACEADIGILPAALGLGHQMGVCETDIDILPAALGLGHQMRVCEADIGILPAALGWGHVLNSKKMQHLRTVPKGQRRYKQKGDR